MLLYIYILIHIYITTRSQIISREIPMMDRLFFLYISTKQCAYKYLQIPTTQCLFPQQLMPQYISISPK